MHTCISTYARNVCICLGETLCLALKLGSVLLLYEYVLDCLMSCSMADSTSVSEKCEPFDDWLWCHLLDLFRSCILWTGGEFVTKLYVCT